jgi:hypothetical protein
MEDLVNYHLVEPIDETHFLMCQHMPQTRDLFVYDMSLRTFKKAAKGNIKISAMGNKQFLVYNDDGYYRLTFEECKLERIQLTFPINGVQEQKIIDGENTSIVFAFSRTAHVHVFDFQGHQSALQFQWGSHEIVGLEHGYFVVCRDSWVALMKINSDLSHYKQITHLALPVGLSSWSQMVYNKITQRLVFISCTGQILAWYLEFPYDIGSPDLYRLENNGAMLSCLPYGLIAPFQFLNDGRLLILAYTRGNSMPTDVVLALDLERKTVTSLRSLSFIDSVIILPANHVVAKRNRVLLFFK